VKSAASTGGLITGRPGLLLMPWRMLHDYRAYIFGWLVGYSALLGPIAGIMIVDYFVVRRRQLVVSDLYLRGRSLPASLPVCWAW